jgi:hypothetical protein
MDPADVGKCVQCGTYFEVSDNLSESCRFHAVPNLDRLFAFSLIWDVTSRLPSCCLSLVPCKHSRHRTKQHCIVLSSILAPLTHR